MLNSIEKDGTGFGYDLETIKILSRQITVPLIVSGGAGKKEHFLEVAKISMVDAFSTANPILYVHRYSWHLRTGDPRRASNC